MGKVKILVVEDSKSTANLIKMSLEKLGYAVSATVGSGEEAIKKTEENNTDLVLMDIILEGEMDGIEAANIIHSRFDIPVIYITALADKNMLKRAKITEPFGYLIKPFKEQELYSNIEIALYKHKTEKKLHENEERFREIVDNITEVFWMASPDFSEFFYVSPAFQSIWGHSCDSLKKNPHTWIDSVHPGDREQIDKMTAKKFAKDKHDIEYRIIRPDGSMRWIRNQSFPVRNKKGDIYRITGIAEDITQKKHSKEIVSNIARGISPIKGDAFFQSLVQYLAYTLGLAYVFISKFVDQKNKRVRTIAFCVDGQIGDNIEYDLANAPCEKVFEKGFCSFPSNVQEKFPLDHFLKEMEIESYVGSPLFDSEKKVLGIMSVMDRKPITNQKIVESMIKIFSVSVEAEIERLRDEDELKHKTNIIQLLQEIAISSNQASTVKEAMQICLDKVCSFTGWPVGHVYLVDSKGNRLIPSKIWHLDGPAKRFKTFQKVTELTSFDLGVGLPGRILVSGKPAWIVDVTKDNNFIRAGLAKYIGIKGGFGFPVLEGKKIVAVLEFFSEEAKDPDTFLLNALSTLAIQLGRVTERKRAEDALLIEYEKFSRILNTMEDGVAIINDNYEIVYANPVIEREFGAYGKRKCYEYFHDITKICSRCKDQNIFEEKTASWEWYSVKNKKTYEISDLPLRNADGSVSKLETFRDITERKKSEAALKEFSKKIVESQEKERKRIAAELHDSLGQNLIVIKDQIQNSVKNMSKYNLNTETLKLASSIDIVKQTINEMREIACNLRPPQLDKLGLKKTILSQIKKTFNISEIKILTKIDIDGAEIQPDIEISIFRIIQEGINNILKHSSASKAVLKLKNSNENLYLEISDNGKGFSRNERASDSDSFGLLGIEERAKMFGGSLQVDSKIGAGTTLKIIIPR